MLDDINYTFTGGRIYGLCGKNGCGKTMLMRLMAGLIYPSFGTIRIKDKILGKDISFPESVGMLIENPSFLNDYTGKQNLEMLAGLQKMSIRQKYAGFWNRWDWIRMIRKILQVFTWYAAAPWNRGSDHGKSGTDPVR